MPWKSKKQARWGHSSTGKQELGADRIEEFDKATDWKHLPKSAKPGDSPLRGRMRTALRRMERKR